MISLIFITAKLRVLMSITNSIFFFLKRSQYISIKNPLHKQSIKARVWF